MADELGIVSAASLQQARAKHLEITVNVAIYTVTPPSGDWGYLKVINNHASAIVLVAINEDPVAAVDAATPAAAADWKAGYPVGPGSSELIPLADGTVTFRLLSDTASTPVILGLVA